jgi:hypothetical protein
MNRLELLTCLLPALATVACTDEPGALTITTWGEDYIEQELPADAFEDGWRVKYTKFLITFSAIRMADADGVLGADLGGSVVFDMTKPGPTTIAALTDVPVLRYDDISVAVKPASAASTGGGAIAADDLARMQQDGWSVYVEGSATSTAGVVKGFTWGFTTATAYEGCEPVDGGGVVVPAGGSATAQLTVHGDHYYYDDLQSADAKLRFDAIAAADKNGDSDITPAELEAVALSDLPATLYKTGSVPGVRTLRDYVAALSRTLVHFQGEGECTSRPL